MQRRLHAAEPLVLYSGSWRRLSVARRRVFQEPAKRSKGLMAMRIRRFANEDMPAIMALQARFFPSSQWSASDYSNLVGRPEGMLLVAELETSSPPQILGFAALQRVADEAELLYMAVEPSHQSRGVGKDLLREAFDRLRKAGVRRVFLEVRVSNRRAFGFYRSQGFEGHSIRKGYYREPAEDAHVMCRELSEPGHPGV